MDWQTDRQNTIKHLFLEEITKNDGMFLLTDIIWIMNYKCWHGEYVINKQSPIRHEHHICIFCEHVTRGYEVGLAYASSLGQSHVSAIA